VGGDRLTIGEFSRITHVSIRALRRYHEQDLLVPAQVDPVTGYRYYAPEQVRPALTIRRFRDLDLPLADLRRFLHAESAGAGAAGHEAAQQVLRHGEVETHLREIVEGGDARSGRDIGAE
jgi:DNA-binding transcriptional MerR regulator